MQFSKDPLNLTNKHSRKVSVATAGDWGVFIAYDLSLSLASMPDF